MPKTLWGLFHYEDGSGYARFQISKVTKHLQPVETFFSLEEANTFLKGAIEKYELCSKLSGLRKVNCAAALPNPCAGACDAEETPNSYNQKVQSFLRQIKASQKEILLEFSGREKGEKAFCVFNHGILTRIGFVSEPDENFDFIAVLELVPRIPETYYLLRQYFPTFQADQIKVLESA
jgi:DNA polymerase-3 subunit epsilon